MYADGYVSSSSTNYNIELALKESDYEHLEKFKKFLNTRNKISYRCNTKSYKITINNKKLHSDLVSKGCYPNKSLIITFPHADIIPDDLLRHFVRGYVDGDGGIGSR